MEVLGVDKVKYVDMTKSNDFFLFEVGRYKSYPGYSFGPVIRTRTIFHYVISGKGHLIMNDNKYELKAGQGFLIPAQCKAFYQADMEDPWEYTWIHIDGPRASELFHAAGLSKDSPIFIPTEDASEILDYIEAIYDNDDKECICYSKVYEFFQCLLSKSSTKPEVEKADPRLAYVKSAISYIQLKYSEPINVDDLANACGLNRSYLTRVFKHATGYTPQSYLAFYRMKKASKMLEETNESVSNIAFMVGYSDSFTFSKAFKRYSSMSPREYRTTHQ